MDYLSEILPFQELFLSFLTYLLFLWIITKILKFKNPSLKKGLWVITLFILFDMVYSFITFYLYFLTSGKLLILYSLRFLVSYAALFYFIAKIYKENWKKALLAVALVVILASIALLLISQLLYPLDSAIIPPIPKELRRLW